MPVACVSVTDVANIYNVRLGGEHCCEVSLNFVFKYLVTLAASLGLSPKLGKDFLTITPLLIFFSSRSHLFMNKINFVWDSYGDEQIAFQRTKGSSRRLMFRSSVSCSSKQEMGARKIMAFTSSKYGSQAGRIVRDPPTS
jgi:hypothetical protein